MLKKKLVKHGNSLALVIDKPILDLLGVDDETELELQTDGRSLRITPALKGVSEGQFREVMDEIHQEWGDVLQRLAE